MRISTNLLFSNVQKNLTEGFIEKNSLRFLLMHEAISYHAETFAP